MSLQLLQSVEKSEYLFAAEMAETEGAKTGVVSAEANVIIANPQPFLFPIWELLRSVSVQLEANGLLQQVLARQVKHVVRVKILQILKPHLVKLCASWGLESVDLSFLENSMFQKCFDVALAYFACKSKSIVCTQVSNMLKNLTLTTWLSTAALTSFSLLGLYIAQYAFATANDSHGPIKKLFTRAIHVQGYRDKILQESRKHLGLVCQGQC